jgi:TP901-1 family phage major tail protein
MAAQKGSNLLLKIEQTPGTFITVAGLRTRALAFNAESVDISHQESAGQWRELLAGAGMRSARVTGSGIFKDAASDALIRSTFFGGAIVPWQIVVPDFGVVQGPFHISSLEFSGRYDSEVDFEIALESAGELVFTAL